MSISNTLQDLKASNEDYEWYPTTNEIIQVVNSQTKHMKYLSILDIGAGDGRVLKALNFETKYAIEKSQILLNKMPKEIIPIGCDFMQNTLIDKNVDVIFCNPPYSMYELWAEKILSEANAKEIFLVIPSRWKESQKIEQIIGSRNYDVEIIGGFDFTNADRKARAKVDLIKFKKTYLTKDSFYSFLDELFTFEDNKEMGTYEIKAKESQKIKQDLINKPNYIEALIELYDNAMNNLMGNYQKISQLDKNILKELNVDTTKLKQGIATKIQGLKNLYWDELFSRYEPITSRLTSKYRQNLLEELQRRTNIDFNIDNVYAVTMWVIKNANTDFSEQMVEFYLDLTNPKNTKPYKSNKHFTKDDFRYMRRDERNEKLKKGGKFKLDYRLVASGNYMRYEYAKLALTQRGVNLLRDFICIANNLGFYTEDILYDCYTAYFSGDAYHIYQKNGDELLEFKPYQNGNIHFKPNQDFLKALNIAVGKILGWLKSPKEANEELKIKEAENLFNLFQLISVNDIKLLK